MDLDVSALCSLGPKAKSRLRTLTVGTLGTDAQVFVLDILGLPSVSLVIKQDKSEDDGPPRQAPAWSTIMHPKVADRLGRITFTSLHYALQTIKLEEDKPANGERCAFTLSVQINGSLEPTALLEQGTAMFDLSHIHTLKMVSVSIACFGWWIRNLVPRGCEGSITKLVLVGAWYDPRLFEHLPALREVHVQCPDDFERSTAGNLIRWLEARNDPDEGSPPLDRVVVELQHWRECLSTEVIERFEGVPGLEFVDNGP